jgi:uncharacterized low-complexity protein
MKKKKTLSNRMITAGMALGLSVNLVSCGKQGVFGVQEVNDKSQPEASEHKCGEGKCGEDKTGADHKCGEGKCGADKEVTTDKTGDDHQCGEGKCGN